MVKLQFNKNAILLRDSRILYNEKMSKHSTFKIGGAVKVYIETSNIVDVLSIFNFCNIFNIKLHIIGSGANILFSSNNINAIILKYTKKEASIVGDYVFCEAGITIAHFLNFCTINKIKGYEFLAGIPGTIGGSVKGNAGGVTEYIGQKICQVNGLKLINNKYKKITLNKKDLKFDYRKSNIDFFITSVAFKCEYGDQNKIKEDIKNNILKKIKAQPLKLPSAGSIFLRQGNFIPSLEIDKLGLKGKRIGDAMVSTLHAGFIVNIGNATSNDVINLISNIKKIIYKNHKVRLKCEIKYIK